MRRWACVAAVAGIMTAAACIDTGGLTANDVGADAGADASGAVALALNPTTVAVRPGKDAQVTVTLARGPATGGATITVVGLPPGVTASPMFLAPDVSTGTVVFHAEASAIVGTVSRALSASRAAPSSEAGASPTGASSPAESAWTRSPQRGPRRAAPRIPRSGPAARRRLPR